MITDEMLAQAAAELANAICDSSPELGACKHQFTPRFERKMQHLIRKANHPIFYRVLRGVASVILVIILGLGSFLAINVEAREAVFSWVKQQYQDFYIYFIVGGVKSTEENESTEAVRYQPGWMPDGCVYVTTNAIAGGKSYVYTNDRHDFIQFSYTSGIDTTRLFANVVEYEHESVLVNGLPGDIYISTNENETSQIVWLDADTHTMFWISGDFTSDELLKIAQSIKITTE